MGRPPFVAHRAHTRTGFSKKSEQRSVERLQQGSRQVKACVLSSHAQKRERARLHPPAPPRGISCDELHITRVILQRPGPTQHHAGPTLRFAAPDNARYANSPRRADAVRSAPRTKEATASHPHPPPRPPPGGCSQPLASAPPSAVVPGAATKMKRLMVSSTPRQDEIVNTIMSNPYSGSWRRRHHHPLFPLNGLPGPSTSFAAKRSCWMLIWLIYTVSKPVRWSRPSSETLSGFLRGLCFSFLKKNSNIGDHKL